jgi:hypothetical protein
MSEFVVTDLYSQKREVENHVQGWTEEAVLSWLCCYGDVYEYDRPGMQGIYRFRSDAGLVTFFSYDADEGFAIKTSGRYYS